MTKNTKHIKMPKAIAEAWLKDLRANPPQGFGALEDEASKGHCCLGRLQVVVSGDVERNEISVGNEGSVGSWKAGSSCGTPSLAWLEKNNIEFLDINDQKKRDPYCANQKDSFVILNDVVRLTLPEIADLLEEEIEYNDPET